MARLIDENGTPLEIKILSKQIELLIQWNKENIKLDPEQARKNIETILAVLDWINKYA